MRLMIVQYAGDYLEAYERLQSSGTETYYGHRYVLEELGRIGRAFGEAAILCCKSPRKYHTRLPSGLTVIGAGADPDREHRSVIRIVNDYEPTHLVVLGPLPAVIRWGVTTNRRVMCLFADSFNTNRIRRFLRYGRLARLLNHPGIDWTANHGLNACLSLAKIGVAPEKIIPWDWPHVRRPDETFPKLGLSSGIPTLVFVGALNERKGIGDVIAALAKLRSRGVTVELKVVGGGEIERFKVLAEKLNVGSSVHFLGIMPNHSVVETMKAAAIVVVPSRHEYPEGFPLTIYEALCARTPIVASDHPMFARRLVHRTSAMIYRAGDPAGLAACVEELISDQNLYRSISAVAQEVWDGLQIPVKWGELLYRWVEGRPEDRQWLFDHRLDSGRYSDVRS